MIGRVTKGKLFIAIPKLVPGTVRELQQTLAHYDPRAFEPNARSQFRADWRSENVNVIDINPRFEATCAPNPVTRAVCRSAPLSGKSTCSGGW
jgi:hypothetical protein